MLNELERETAGNVAADSVKLDAEGAIHDLDSERGEANRAARLLIDDFDELDQAAQALITETRELDARIVEEALGSFHDDLVPAIQTVGLAATVLSTNQSLLDSLADDLESGDPRRTLVHAILSAFVQLEPTREEIEDIESAPGVVAIEDEAPAPEEGAEEPVPAEA